ncbi:MAG: class I SAM-dependent methyltransferase [Gemmataceae bacterium]
MFLLSHLLKRFVRTGTLRVVDPSGNLREFAGAPGPVVTFRLHDRRLPRKLFFNPELAVGEAYMDGTLTFEDCSLYDFLHLFSINRLALGAYPLQAVLRKLWRRLRSWQQYNPVSKAQKNVAHHYDLSRRLYELFLDADLQYSCGYFANADDTLEQAQENKKRLIAAKLRLEPGMKVLDIGSGWGGLGLFLADAAGVDVTGVTLSEEQHKLSSERARNAGLATRVRFQLRDYREVADKFDRVVSVGMMEHVGVRHYGEFFAKVRNLLTDDGIALIHAIGKMSPPGTTGPWLRKYIFPGAYTPALSEVFEAVERQGLWVSDVEILRLHYAETLREWRRRFETNRAEIASLYDERFCRMWEFYLVACEMVFRHGSGMVFHLQLTRRRDAVPVTRNYIAEEEQRYLPLETRAKQPA